MYVFCFYRFVMCTACIVCVWGVGGACVALCLVLTHPAINCVSTAAVCMGQIESSATGPFCFSPLGWASRPSHSHWSQTGFFSFFFSISLRLSLSFSSLYCVILPCLFLLVDRQNKWETFLYLLFCKWHTCFVSCPSLYWGSPTSLWEWDNDYLLHLIGSGSDFRLLQTVLRQVFGHF